MSIIRWDPFAEVDRMFNGLMPRLSAGEARRAPVEWAPSADISETDKEYLIRAELPAVNREDIKVTLAQGLLTIEGERKQRKEHKDEKYHRVESFYGSFSRTFSLPENVKADAIRCESKEGVLTVHIPKTEQPKATQISVQ